MLVRRFALLLFALAGCSAPSPGTEVRSAAPRLASVQSVSLAEARPAGVTGTLVFHADREGRHRLFTIDLASGAVTRITEGRDYHDEQAAPSPDGARVAFVTTRFDHRTWDIGLLDVKSGAITRLTDHLSFDRHPAWTPDGLSLFLSSEREGTQAVFRTTVEAPALVRVSPEPERGLMPAVSPDARRVAYVAGTTQGLRVVVQDLSSGERRAVTPEGVDCADPRWSPDGSRLAYTRLVPGGASLIEVVRLDNGESRALAIEGLAALREPAWSPDGRWLAAAASAQAGKGFDWDLVLLRPDASAEAHRLTSGAGHDRAPAWMPR